MRNGEEKDFQEADSHHQGMMRRHSYRLDGGCVTGDECVCSDGIDSEFISIYL